MRIKITEELLKKHGISQNEYNQICKYLSDREPTLEELGVFSVMWSEHCSYRSSRPYLKQYRIKNRDVKNGKISHREYSQLAEDNNEFFSEYNEQFNDQFLPVLTDGKNILIKAGEENAGVLDIGDGWAIAFKIESHNHPSAVEPFQGAATGVGGIIRDIFTMGARPLFLMNSLRFGLIDTPEKEAERNRYLFSHVVAGISHYGNCIGLPTIGGEIYFDETYTHNPLVNVFCLGLLKHDQIRTGAATGVGNPIFYLGSKTGSDGLAGATFASRDLAEESQKHHVQVGDPFTEKLLLEACLELMATDAVIGIQDMGAAGLTCSLCETASRGNSGVEIDIDLVPKRFQELSAYEMLLSESQERMIVIVKIGQEEIVKEIFNKWDLPYSQIGYVTNNNRMRVKKGDEILVDIPSKALTDHSHSPPIYQEVISKNREIDYPKYINPQEILPRLLSDPTISSKQWVWSQYDYMIGSGTMVYPGSDAAVFYIHEANKIIAATTDCCSLYCKINPYEGAILAVAEAVTNLACSGAKPLGMTNNLNFGNPNNSISFSHFVECCSGMWHACREFDIPVTGGNVSFYNETVHGAINPTPTIGLVGLIQEPSHITTQFFKKLGDHIFLLGNIISQPSSIVASHYLSVIHGTKEGQSPILEFRKAKLVNEVLLDLIKMGFIASAHDCSEGGIAVALAECCFQNNLGAEITLDDQSLRDDLLLFNEHPSRVIISVDPKHVESVRNFLNKKVLDSSHEIFQEKKIFSYSELGIVGTDQLTFKFKLPTSSELLVKYSWFIKDLKKNFDESIENIMESKIPFSNM